MRMCIAQGLWFSPFFFMLCARYWEAIKKWDEALLLTPNDSKMLEMKAQVKRLWIWRYSVYVWVLLWVCIQTELFEPWWTVWVTHLAPLYTVGRFVPSTVFCEPAQGMVKNDRLLTDCRTLSFYQILHGHFGSFGMLFLHIHRFRWKINFW